MWKKLATNFKAAFAEQPRIKANIVEEIDSIYWDPDLINHLKGLIKNPQKK